MCLFIWDNFLTAWLCLKIGVHDKILSLLPSSLCVGSPPQPAERSARKSGVISTPKALIVRRPFFATCKGRGRHKKGHLPRQGDSGEPCWIPHSSQWKARRGENLWKTCLSPIFLLGILVFTCWLETTQESMDCNDAVGGMKQVELEGKFWKKFWRQDYMGIWGNRAQIWGYLWPLRSRFCSSFMDVVGGMKGVDIQGIYSFTSLSIFWLPPGLLKDRDLLGKRSRSILFFDLDLDLRSLF